MDIRQRVPNAIMLGKTLAIIIAYDVVRLWTKNPNGYSQILTFLELKNLNAKNVDANDLGK